MIPLDVQIATMPSLFLFRRQWLVGSDDFVFSSIVSATVRCIWGVFILILWTTKAHDISACEHGLLLHLYFLGIVLTQTVIVYWNFILMRNSMKGTVMKTEERKLIPFILYVKVFLEGINMILNAYGSVLVFSFDLNCLSTSSIVTMLKCFVVFSWASHFLLITFIVIIIGSPGDKRARSSLKYRSLWKRRCRCLFCSCFPHCSKIKSTNSSDKFDTVASILSSFFQGIDLVPSDVLAGLALLSFRHKEDKHMNLGSSYPQEKVSLHADQSQLSQLNLNDSKSSLAIIRSLTEQGHGEWMNYKTALYFFKFATGSYGWKLYGYNQLKKGKCCFPSDLFRLPSLQSSAQITKDNCCRCNLAAVKTTTQLTDEEILYASFKNRYLEVPFYVAVDYDTSSIVVSIRGTLSLCDALTDVTAGTELISAPGVPKEWTAHKGILLAAKRIQAKLEASSDILLTAVTNNPSFQLIITGHSLGAGIACVLSILLKCRFPQVKCIAFSPPGGLLCLDAAKYSEKFCMSVVIGRDLIPRLSVQTAELLKKIMIEELTICPLPKYQILIHASWLSLFRYFIPSTVTLHDYMLTREKYQVTESTQTQDKENMEQSVLKHEWVEPFYLPGCILHIMRDGKQYRGFWAQREDFSSIVVSTRMFEDHFTDSVLDALLALA